MRDHNVARLEHGRQLPAYFQKRVVIRDKNLDHIAHLRNFRRPAYEIRHRPRCAVPHENMKPLFA